MRVLNKYEYGMIHSFIEIQGVGAFEDESPVSVRLERGNKA